VEKEGVRSSTFTTPGGVSLEKEKVHRHYRITEGTTDGRGAARNTQSKCKMEGADRQ